MAARKRMTVGIVAMVFLAAVLAAMPQKELLVYKRTFTAVINGNRTYVEKALSRGLSPNAVVPGLGSLLMQATIHGHIDIIKLLLAHGADPRAKDNQALAIAAVNTGKLSVLKLVVEAGAPVQVKKDACHKDDVLLDALQSEHPEMLPYLLKHGADPNGTIAIGNFSALQLAAMTGDVDSLRRLVNAGANVNHRDANGWTALVYACKKGHIRAVKFLLANGADPTYEDRHGRTAETFAGEYNGKNTKELRVLCAGKRH